MSDCKRCEKLEGKITELRGQLSELSDQCFFCNFEEDSERFAEQATQAQRVVWELHNANGICLCEVCRAYRHD